MSHLQYNQPFNASSGALYRSLILDTLPPSVHHTRMIINAFLSLGNSRNLEPSITEQ